MGELVGIVMVFILVIGVFWAIHEGSGFGKDLANYQIAKRMREQDLERRVKALEARK